MSFGLVANLRFPVKRADSGQNLPDYGRTPDLTGRVGRRFITQLDSEGTDAMRAQFLLSTLHRRRIVIASALCLIAAGGLVGQLTLVWTSLVGTSMPAIATLIAGLMTGVLIGRAAALFLDGSAPSSSSAGGSLTSRMAVSGMIIAVSWVLPELLRTSLDAGCLLFGKELSLSGGVTPLETLPTLLFPCSVIGVLTGAILFWRRSLDVQLHSDRVAMSVFSCVGMCVLMLHAWFSLPLATTVSVLVIVATVANLLCGRAELSPRPARPATTGRGLASRFGLLVPMTSGILVIAIFGLMNRLIPISVPVLMQSLLIAVLFVSLVTRPVTQRIMPARIQSSVALVLLSLLPLVFSRLIDWNLSLRTSISSPLLLTWLHSLQLAGPIALAMVTCFYRYVAPVDTSVVGSQARLAEIGDDQPALSMLFGVGCLGGLALLTWGVAPAAILAGGLGVQCVLIAVREYSSASSILSRQRRRMSAAFAASLAVACPLIVLTGFVNSPRATQLLFSDRSLAAVRLGVDRELIPFSDASRLVTREETPQGEVQIWHRNGHVVEFRRNGKLLGQVSTDTDRSPQPIEEILPAILPLVAHKSPDRILLLGDETGVCLRICSHFPIQRIVAVRSDQKMTDLARQFTWRRQQPTPDRDERVTVLHESAAIAVRRRSEIPFDVVIEASPAATVGGNAFEYTTEFYEAVRRQLSADGVFCQRFRQKDLGAEPLKQLIATAMDSFRHVIAVETTPGEVALLASNAESGLIGDQIMSRLQLDHIRREIATAGWDWTQVAVLPMLDATDPLGMFSQQPIPRAISISNSRFALALPLDSNPILDRSAEMQESFGPHQVRIVELLPQNDDHKELKRRVSSLSQEIEILAGMPDEPWTYRKSLRMELQRNPRAPKDVFLDDRIVRTAHPLDKLQTDYFVTLGRSIQRVRAGETSYEAFADLEDFTIQHEPLLSHFAYYELVRLHELTGHPSPGNEFRHRLHTVYFTGPTDASVRPVIAAIQQLVDQPELLASDEDRYDQMNSLIQKLIERWEARTVWEPRSAVRVENDVEQSVLVTNRAIDRMESWAPAADVAVSEFYKRRRFINAALIAPLRNYREQVLAHRLKTEAQTGPDAAGQGGEVPDDLPLVIPPQDLQTN